MTTQVPSPHVSSIPSPHATLVPSPHHSPITPVSAILLQPGGSPVQIVDLGEGESSSSESMEFDEVARKVLQVEKG